MFFAARGLGPLLQVLDLPVERTHAVNRAVDTIDEALAFVVGETELADRDRRAHHCVRQLKTVAAMQTRILLYVDRRQFFLKRSDFLVKLVERVDLGEKCLQAFVDNLFRDFLFVEGDQLFNGADALLEVLA